MRKNIRTKSTQTLFIDAIAGSGKTEAAIKHMIEREHYGEKFILIQPTKLLIEKTAERIVSSAYKGSLKTIVSEDGAETVTKQIHDFLSYPENGGVLIITFDGWARIQRRDLSNWNLIVDECPTVFKTSNLKAKSVASQLIDHLEVKPFGDTNYYVVEIKEGSRDELNDLIKRATSDKAVKLLLEPTQHILLRMKTYVSKSHWDRYVQGEIDALTFYHVTTSGMFTGFKSVTIMSANFQDNILYHMWSAQGVRLYQRFGFGQEILPSIHPKEVGEKLDIYYLCDEWSSKKKKDHEPIYKAEFQRAVKEIFGDEPFIYTINSSDSKFLLEGFANGRYVAPKAHGLNEYRTLNNAAIYGHFNLSCDQVAFLSNVYGISKEFIWDLWNQDIYYQFSCRISLREIASQPSCVSRKKLVFMDKAMALYIQKKFPSSRVHRFQSSLIDSIPVKKNGRKLIGTKPLSGSERSKRNRDKKLEIHDGKKLDILQGNRIEIQPGSEAGIRDETSLRKNNSDNYNVVGGGWSISSMGYLTSTDIVTINASGMDHVVALLEIFSERDIDSKADNKLFNLTRFIEEDGVPRGRKLTDVDCSYAILQDMDSEDNCCPYEYAKLFGGIEMLIYSSFQSTPEMKRWRVVIPLSRPVTEPEYNGIVKDLKRISLAKGFPFDAKVRSNDFMYLPCHGQCEEAFMFEHFKGENRRPLDVDDWME